MTTSQFRKFLRLSFSVVTALSMVSCASGGANSGPSPAKFSLGSSSSSFRLPSFEEKTLPNGLRVLFIPDETLPYVSYSLLIKSGSAQDPENLTGLASMVAELLDKGTSKRSAEQIAKDIGVLGADFDVSATYDYTMVSASSISPVSETLLKNVLEIVQNPAFSDQEIERVRKQTLAGIERRIDNPDGYADLAFAEFLYGAHPYGQPTSGTAKTVAAIKKRNIVQFYLRAFQPGNSILAVVGKYTPELKAKIEQGFGGWEKREATESKFPELTANEGRQYRLVDKPGLVQAQIRIGSYGIKRSDPDFVALRVANTILGGAFESRLMNRIRKDLGLTYSINSGFDARREAGPFSVETFTKNATTGQTVTETLKVLEDFRNSGVTSAELDRAKGYLTGIFPAAIETPEKLAYNLLVLRLYGIPDSYLTNYLGKVDDLSVSEVNRAIQKHLEPKNLKILVYS
ncbi:MAG: pitrilysin family protein, partial [Bdellovibrionota bacterium]